MPGVCKPIALGDISVDQLVQFHLAKPVAHGLTASSFQAVFDGLDRRRLRIAKRGRPALDASENCARKATSQNQEHLVAKKAKKRTVRPYTKTEEKELRAHSKAKTPVAKISKITKRSVAALRKKAGQMGFPLGHRR
jgi:hypothetical protein